MVLGLPDLKLDIEEENMCAFDDDFLADFLAAAFMVFRSKNNLTVHISKTNKSFSTLRWHPGKGKLVMMTDSEITADVMKMLAEADLQWLKDFQEKMIEYHELLMQNEERKIRERLKEILENYDKFKKELEEILSKIEQSIEQTQTTSFAM